MDKPVFDSFRSVTSSVDHSPNPVFTDRCKEGLTSDSWTVASLGLGSLSVWPCICNAQLPWIRDKIERKINCYSWMVQVVYWLPLCCAVFSFKRSLSLTTFQMITVLWNTISFFILKWQMFKLLPTFSSFFPFCGAADTPVWTSGIVSPGFQNQGGCLTCVLPWL